MRSLTEVFVRYGSWDLLSTNITNKASAATSHFITSIRFQKLLSTHWPRASAYHSSGHGLLHNPASICFILRLDLITSNVGVVFFAAIFAGFEVTLMTVKQK
mmetsp:Transcript_10551/g.19071  ORF Transcript_10551/g.19071 Transcript_10551/m.19071 type:complete len:102 (+) Transcript_10551:252-557(+)